MSDKGCLTILAEFQLSLSDRDTLEIKAKRKGTKENEARRPTSPPNPERGIKDRESLLD